MFWLLLYIGNVTIFGLFVKTQTYMKTYEYTHLLIYYIIIYTNVYINIKKREPFWLWGRRLGVCFNEAYAWWNSLYMYWFDLSRWECWYDHFHFILYLWWILVMCWKGLPDRLSPGSAARLRISWTKRDLQRLLSCIIMILCQKIPGMSFFIIIILARLHVCPPAQLVPCK